MATASELAALTNETSLLSYLGSSNSYGGATLLQGVDFNPSLKGLDPAGTPTVHYKMRALANPGPGYVIWTVTGTPDFVGTYAPSAIQPGTAVLTGNMVRP